MSIAGGWQIWAFPELPPTVAREIKKVYFTHTSIVCIPDTGHLYTNASVFGEQFNSF